MDLAEGESRTLSLYLLDWDESGRSQKIEIFDTSSTVLMHSVVVNAFATGNYLHWNVGGNIRIKISTVNGPNAVVPELLID